MTTLGILNREELIQKLDAYEVTGKAARVEVRGHHCAESQPLQLRSGGRAAAPTTVPAPSCHSHLCNFVCQEKQQQECVPSSGSYVIASNWWDLTGTDPESKGVLEM